MAGRGRTARDRARHGGPGGLTREQVAACRRAACDRAASRRSDGRRWTLVRVEPKAWLKRLSWRVDETPASENSLLIRLLRGAGLLGRRPPPSAKWAADFSNRSKTRHSRFVLNLALVPSTELESNRSPNAGSGAKVGVERARPPGGCARAMPVVVFRRSASGGGARMHITDRQAERREIETVPERRASMREVCLCRSLGEGERESRHG